MITMVITPSAFSPKDSFVRLCIPTWFFISSNTVNAAFQLHLKGVVPPEIFGQESKGCSLIDDALFSFAVSEFSLLRIRLI